MRVAYVCADAGVPVFGCKGCSIHVQEMLRAMIGRGFDVELFAPRIDGSCPKGLEPVRVHRLPRLRANREAATTRQVEQENQASRDMIEDAPPFDLVYERYSLWSFVGLEFARQQGTPGILEVNAPLIEEQAAYRGLMNRHVAEVVARRAFKAASALVAVSPEVADYLEKWPEAEGRTHVVSNGVNVSRFGPLKSEMIRHTDDLTIGFVGTLKPWHGVQDLLNAFSQLLPRFPRLKLRIVGDGPERERLERQAREISRTAITFVGAVPPVEIPAQLERMDIGVAPYPQMEPCYFSPLKLYEYAAAGLAIVSSDIGEPGRVIEHEVNGLLCRPSDPADLARQLERLNCHPQERIALGRTAHRRVSQNHTWGHVLQRILETVDRPTPVLL